MNKNNIKLLDCTLRDGGYINAWKWDFERARNIIALLVKAGIDIIEIGFLRNVKEYNPDITVCNYIEELNKLIPNDINSTMFSAMTMNGSYNLKKLKNYTGEGIELIRVTAHDHDIKNGLNLANEIIAKGYKVSINPINIMGYSDEQLLWIVEQVNQIQPYQFSIVDTFGSMKRRDLERIVSIIDHNLSRNIRLALHLHENMSLCNCLAQNFIDNHLRRPISIDGSLMGMGRNPGNLPIELIADYINDYMDTSYNIDYLMDAIQDYIAPLKGDTEWGYSPSYFLSARFNLHRNYVEHYLNKGDLTNRDINHILSRFDLKKKTNFDAVYADEMYKNYKCNKIDDSKDRLSLKQQLMGKNILVIVPGASIINYKEKIDNYILENNPIIFSVNFIPDNYKINYSFISNRKRFNLLNSFSEKIIVTSNLLECDADYKIDYNSLCGAFNQGCNSLIMLLNLLCDLQVNKVVLAGADGYNINGHNYYNTSIRSYTVHGNEFNIAVADALHNLKMPLYFLTPSEYDIE